MRRLLPLVAASSLADHPSPYLALHTDAPVQWQLWSKALPALLLAWQ